jgi:hypothetical protein
LTLFLSPPSLPVLLRALSQGSNVTQFITRLGFVLILGQIGAGTALLRNV